MQYPRVLDNKTCGKVIDVLKNQLHVGTRLSVISAYFSIYAFAELKKELFAVASFRHILTQPEFAEKPKENKEFYIEPDEEGFYPEPDFTGSDCEIWLTNEMKQVAVTKECSALFRKKAEVKSFRKENLAQPRSISVKCGEESLNVNGTVDFTPDGLGIIPSGSANCFTLYTDLVDTISIFVAEQFFYTAEYPVRTPLTGETARNLIRAV